MPTIVGGIGSYLMRLIKTSTVGTRLHEHYTLQRDARLGELVGICTRLDEQVSKATCSAQTLRAVPASTEGR